MRDYLDTLIARYSGHGSRLCIVVPLISGQHLLLAERVLALRRVCTDVRLLAVITESQQAIYDNGGQSKTALQRKWILDAAEQYEVIPEYSRFVLSSFLYRQLIGRCNLIIFSSYRSPKNSINYFWAQLSMSANRPIVRYLTVELGQEEYESLEPALDLAESIDYIRRNRFRVLSDCIPDKLLEKWLAGSSLPYFKFFASIENTADIFRFKDSGGISYLPLKVFAYAYFVRQDLLVGDPRLQTPDRVRTHFGQFQMILRLIAQARAKEIEIGRFDIFDFDNYDELVGRLGWVQRLEYATTRLSDLEIENAPSIE